MPELSPTALHVWDAFNNIVEGHGPPRLGIAAALRAAALYSYCPVDRRILATIADELENDGQGHHDHPHLSDRPLQQQLTSK